jgi:glycosyltransferase involved in cell wall biosynthesis
MALTSLKVIGPFKGPTGYEHHVREFVRELDRQGVAIELVDFPAWGPAKLPRHLREPWFETLTKPSRARVLLHFCLPPQVLLDTTRGNVNYTMFEATRLPPRWVEHNRKCDVIILPTESSRRAWINSGMPAQHMRLCPLGINPSLFRTPVPALELYGANGELLNQHRVRFLNVSELRPRKNLLGLLRAWIKATSPEDDAVLLIKLGCYEPGAWELFRDQLNVLEQHIGKTLDQAAPVHFLYDILPDADMPRLYAAATHYISLSLGEGWDQPMVEAAASDLKLIAPNHSAYPTYLDTTVAHLLASREVPIVFKDDGGSGTRLQQAHWWEPDEDEAIHCIRLAIEGGDWGKASARSRILGQFTWEKATHRLIDILSEVEARHKRSRFWLPSQWYKRVSLKPRHDESTSRPEQGSS